MRRLEYLQKESGGLWVFSKEIRGQLYALFCDIFIACFLSLIITDRSYLDILGLLLTFHFFGSIIRYCSGYIFYKKPLRLHLLTSIVLGSILGSMFFEIFVGGNPIDLIINTPEIAIKRTLFGMLYCLIAGNNMYHIFQKSKVEKSLLEQQKQNLQYEKDLMEVELMVLQSQIEPHFLFNTLANIQALIDGNPKSAKQMLTQFTDLLRHSLARTRSKKTTIGMELDILEKYLSIQQHRLGERLHYCINCSEEDRQITIAPLLVQPLVENAVIHGIEPSIEGGKVTISITNDNHILEIKIADTGQGFSGETQGQGIGLTNVRNRLKALYGDKASLSISEQNPKGVLSKIVIQRNSDD